jgi:predicted phosphohydrolase
VIPGDISWALTCPDALSDIKFLDSLSGKKIIMKGNHDFWWTSVTKMKNMFEENGIKSIEILNNNALEVEKYIITGSRGWFIDPSSQTKSVNADFDKVNNREVIRLKIGLDEAKKLQSTSSEKEIVTFFHFPPYWGEFKNSKIIDMLCEYGVKRCYFGHIHGLYSIPRSQEFEGIRMTMISADFLDFTPMIVMPADY